MGAERWGHWEGRAVMKHRRAVTLLDTTLESVKTGAELVHRQDNKTWRAFGESEKPLIKRDVCVWYHSTKQVLASNRASEGKPGYPAIIKTPSTEVGYVRKST